MLDMLAEGGTGIAIIPVSCVIAPSKAKSEIVKYHRLKAVMSMPSELFYPVGTVTCIVVFEAHKPHFQTVVIDPDTQEEISTKKPVAKRGLATGVMTVLKNQTLGRH